MSKHTLFIVHGMGDYEKGWSLDIQKLLKGLYQSYPLLNQVFPFDEQFIFEEILYNDCFDSRRDAWKENAQDVLGEFEKAGVPKEIRDILETTSVDPAKDKFVYTHLLDVAFYRYFVQIREQIKSRVASQFLTVLDKQSGAENWSIIAHSLGTSIVHDALHALYTHSVPDTPQLTTAMTRPSVLMMISNLSRVLQKDANAYTSIVRPSSDPASGVCDFYLNARHEYDLFAAVKAFSPQDDWPDVGTRSKRPKHYLDIRTNAFEKANIHGFSHYLKNPKVHVPLFRSLTFEWTIPDEHLDRAVMQYEASTPMGEFEDLRQAIKKLRPSKEASLKQAYKAWKEFLITLEEFV